MLGGGIGWLMRKHGLACDNLRSAEVLTADGQILTASATENPDLFWGLRGGGGNFGVVTSFEFDLHPVGPTVAACPASYPRDRAKEVMRFYREFACDLPDELSTLVNLITAPPAPFLPEDWHGKKLIGLAGSLLRRPRRGDEGAAADLRPGRPRRRPGRPNALRADAEPVRPALAKGHPGLHEGGLLPRARRPRDRDDGPLPPSATSPSSEIHIQHFGGAIARVDEDETAIGERQAPFVLNAIATTHEPGGLETHIDRAERLYAEIEPSLTGGSYINFLSSEGEDRVKAAYGTEKFTRLRALKDRYDPTNLFHLNQNIPASSSSR